MMGFETEEEMMAELERRTVAMQAHAERINREQPGLPPITVIIMANDAAGADMVDAAVRAGELSYETALWQLGSYSRMEYALQWQEDGFATRDELLDKLPDLWPGSDPDDTDERFLELFREAFERNGGIVTDGKDLRPGKTLTVYRGQRPYDEVGFAWSLDPKVAQKFANGASFRQPVAGEVIQRKVAREQVLAYFTGRNEKEVILDLEEGESR